GKRSFSLKYVRRSQIRSIQSVGVSFNETILISRISSHSASVQLVPCLSLKLAILYNLFVVFMEVYVIYIEFKDLLKAVTSWLDLLDLIIIYSKYLDSFFCAD